MSLYLDHLATLQRQAEAALERAGHDALVIAAGIEKYAFLDDRPYLFQANPHFKHWLPLTNHPHSWMAVRPGHKPRVVYYQPHDYWHVPPEAPSGEWVAAVELVVIREPEQAARALADLVTPRTALLGEADAALPGLVPNNPERLLNLLHWARGVKTPYELEQMRAAQRRAVPGHLAARAAFLQGESEAGIHRAYLLATGHTDRDLPYTNIIGLNEHAAVLHYQYQDASPPAQARSFLIDAGAQVNGYASDITRTWAAPGHEEFAALIAAMEREQLALVDEVREGVDYRDIHLSTHRRVARVLREAGIVRMSDEAMVAEGVTKPFFPHGIGHLLGLQVHDVGGFMASEEGGVAAKPEGHRYLRLTRPLQAGMVVTIEPGLYFIPMLLDELRATPHAAQVDWAAVERLSRYGGIRIEDDVACRARGEAPENLTRDAFAAA
ncbi:Xaa-Pro dipeptidase [Roseateles puraquae]|uniref:Xaa-Pro dipeptidase n=1 Tax=Roseateles puraquae TaxID=431059 RepID=A0A254N1Y6_9BURK|nr:Xaa-Pro dipeptidase [Roseateles puraquae]MDG0853103.1 Xaa-Pro dipeptidase [Roseateles puraquae]OWR02219.1 Xaa-Pro dipeptidase [Roseateles puraquae]